MGESGSNAAYQSSKFIFHCTCASNQFVMKQPNIATHGEYYKQYSNFSYGLWEEILIQEIIWD